MALLIPPRACREAPARGVGLGTDSTDLRTYVARSVSGAHCSSSSSNPVIRKSRLTAGEAFPMEQPFLVARSSKVSPMLSMKLTLLRSRTTGPDSRINAASSLSTVARSTSPLTATAQCPSCRVVSIPNRSGNIPCLRSSAAMCTAVAAPRMGHEVTPLCRVREYRLSRPPVLCRVASANPLPPLKQSRKPD